MPKLSPPSPSIVSAAIKSAVQAKGGVAVTWDGITLPAPQKRERMEHIDRALQKVRRHDNGDMELPSAVRFARELGVKAPRTIQRLIEEMRAIYGLPIDYCHRRKGYFYEEDVAFLPFLQLSESELVAVYLTQQLGVFENTPFKTRLKSAFRKLIGLFGGKMSFDSALLDECFRSIVRVPMRGFILRTWMRASVPCCARKSWC